MTGNTSWAYVNGHAELRFPSGLCILLDADDVPLVAEYSWRTIKPRNSWYAYTSPGDTFEYMHRLLLSAPPELYVDHRNGNGLDNRRQNLRLCTQVQNSANAALSRRNTTGYKGVIRYKERFRARHSRRHLGYFDTAWEAAQAYNAAAVAMHGDFARLNVRST